MPVRCAAYARYSIDRQSPLSLEDQIRRCREFAERQGWSWLETQIYMDEAISGTSTDRPGLRKLMEAVGQSPAPFEVLLVDDTSRLSRNQGDVARIFERLNFAGVRVVAVSQGIDSQDEQADVLVTVHGLLDSLYVKELAKKTHRGLEGKILRGLHAGGRTYGYQAVHVEGGTQLAVNEEEAAVVRRIFEMSAEGNSLRTIARTLNAESILAPRSREGKSGG